MEIRDSLRKWMWWFLLVIAALQVYAVRELLAAFAIFILGFTAIAVCVGGLYFLHKGWEAGIGRLAASKHPRVLAARRSVSALLEDIARRPMRRPDSEAAR
jgi:membrane protein implicated in regulation of membrane protease activity